jgi:hypothetical protein
MLRPYKGMNKNRDGSGGSCAEILVGGVGGAGFGPVAVGAGHVDDDAGFFFGWLGFQGDGAVGVEELAGDEGQDGGAAGRNASFGDEGEETGEELADVGAGGELGEFGEEVGGEVFRVSERLLRGARVALTEMMRAKPKVRL